MLRGLQENLALFRIVIEACEITPESRFADTRASLAAQFNELSEQQRVFRLLRARIRTGPRHVLAREFRVWIWSKLRLENAPPRNSDVVIDGRQLRATRERQP